MNITTRFLFIMISLSFICSITAQTQTDEEAIKKIIQTSYVEGLQNEGDFEKIDLGFHKDFNLLGIDKETGNMWKYPITKWKESVAKKLEDKKMPRKGDDKISVQFLSVDFTNNAAVVKLEFYIGTKIKYVDYISLYKFGSDWKIVSKIYTDM